MKTFRCSHCGGIAFFDDTFCTACGHALAFAPDRRAMVALAAAGNGAWNIVGDAEGAVAHLCSNAREEVCNWLLPVGMPPGLCSACRLTTMIPNLARPGHREAWGRLERAKRRLLWTLQGLGLGWRSRSDDPAGGLTFDFLSDADMPEGERATTGHLDGNIVVAAEEADDAVIAERRRDLREPYRTVLGHFRHEAGHYYWNVLIRDRGRIDAFRATFGDERADYVQAQASYYGALDHPHWRDAFISEYASMHPWEDWAESFAHYLHMVDGVETAIDLAVRVAPNDGVRPAVDLPAPAEAADLPFDDLLRHFSGLSVVLNQFSRGMGLSDAYPFAPSARAIEKFRFVDAEVRAFRDAP